LEVILLYKAVVIDDEPWVIKTLLESVKWADYHFKIVGTATESRKGLEMIRSIRPELVLIDIRMPEMSGLECMKQVKHLQLQTQFIVVSGFAEFSYAQKCLQLGAVGYCLKPIDEDEIEALLKKVKEDLDLKQSKEMPSLIERIMDDAADSRLQTENCLAAKGISFDKERPLRAVCCLGIDKPLDLIGFRHILLHEGYRKTILLVQEDAYASVYDQVASKRNNMFKGTGISTPISRFEQVKSAIEEAELAAHQYFLTGRSSICQAVSQGNEASYAEFREIYPALQRRDMAELDVLFNRCLERLTSGRLRVKHALLLYHTVMTAIIHSDSADETIRPNFIHDYELLIERYQTIEEMVKDLKRMTIAYLGNMFTGASRNIRSDNFKAILHYIHENSHEEITLQKLSDTYYINPNYISQLFVKHLGKPFTGYVAELRVRNACCKLKTGNQSIQEIAAAVGISDPYYFSKIFRKITGVSPREYRKSNTPPELHPSS
jgi:two-component system response regulator YesN